MMRVVSRAWSGIMKMRELEILDLSVKFRNVALWRGLQPRDADAVAFEFLLHLMNGAHVRSTPPAAGSHGDIRN